jgi:hypothetical protein
MFCQFYQALMAVSRLIWNSTGTVQGLDGCLTVSKNADVALFYTLHYTSINGIYMSAWNIVVWSPKMKLNI